MSVEAAQDNVTGTQLTVAGNGEVFQPPDLITEQEVVFSTAAAVAPRSTPISGRLIDALRIVTAALRPPPPRPHYAHRASYIERACMSREMDRL